MLSFPGIELVSQVIQGHEKGNIILRIIYEYHYLFRGDELHYSLQVCAGENNIVCKTWKRRI